MVPILNQVGNNVVETKKMIKSMSIEINKLHKILGHHGETHLKATANAYGIKVFGKLEACESCTLNKAKQKEEQQGMNWIKQRSRRKTMR
jgi:hypothetical protein